MRGRNTVKEVATVQCGQSAIASIKRSWVDFWCRPLGPQVSPLATVAAISRIRRRYVVSQLPLRHVTLKLLSQNVTDLSFHTSSVTQSSGTSQFHLRRSIIFSYLLNTWQIFFKYNFVFVRYNMASLFRIYFTFFNIIFYSLKLSNKLHCVRYI